MERSTGSSDLNELNKIIARFARQSEGGIALGPHGTLRFEYFNDLLSAVHIDAHLEVITNCLTALVRDTCAESSITVIACPKRGNVLLGRDVARALKLKSLFVRDDVLASRHVEGFCQKNEKVILVDDISSDGDLLFDAIEGLRKEGFHVTNAFTVIDRTEGNAVERLRKEGIHLRSSISLSDSDIHLLINGLKDGSIN